MRWNDDEFDRLVSRRLDGEATQEESLALERARLRSPEARERMAVCERIDGLAGAALRGAAAPTGPALRLDLGSAKRRTGRRWRAPLALAAAVLLAAGLTLSVAVRDTPSEPGTPRDDGAPRPTLHAASGPALDTGPTRLRRVSDYAFEAPFRRKRQIDRDYIVIQDDEADRYYLLEMKRTRTVIIRARGDL